MKRCKYFENIVHKIGRSGIMCAGMFSPMTHPDPEVRRELLKVHLKYMCNGDHGRCSVAVALELSKEAKKERCKNHITHAKTVRTGRQRVH